MFVISLVRVALVALKLFDTVHTTEDTLSNSGSLIRKDTVGTVHHVYKTGNYEVFFMKHGHLTLSEDQLELHLT